MTHKEVKISASLVMELRKQTGHRVMVCKEALVKTNGDFEEAKKWIRINYVGLKTSS